jgi:class 3 adenylate cyclase
MTVTLTAPGADSIAPLALAERMARDEPVLILDVRRPDRWSDDRERIPGAAWVPHDEVIKRAHELPRDRDVVVYCSCPGEATSARVARWLRDRGFPRVMVLRGGLDGWRRAGLATAPFIGGEPAADGAPLRSLAERLLGEAGLPTRARLATLFVDIAGSTRLLAHHPAETVLACVQRFMRLVTDVALAYCGDVKDFEGDGALLYFESASEAVEAALAIRAALADGVCEAPCPMAGRMSVTVGDVVLGVVGSRLRHAVALVGPSVSIGARLLKRIAPGGIIATGEVVEALRVEMPELAQDFRLLDAAFEVPATDGITVATWTLEAHADENRRVRRSRRLGGRGWTDGNS